MSEQPTVTLCTEAELLNLWLCNGIDDAMSFPEYVAYKERHGWKIIKEDK